MEDTATCLFRSFLCQEWRLEARDRYWHKGSEALPALAPPMETLNFSDELTELDRHELSTEAVRFEIVLAERQVEPPLWLEAPGLRRGVLSVLFVEGVAAGVLRGGGGLEVRVWLVAV